MDPECLPINAHVLLRLFHCNQYFSLADEKKKSPRNHMSGLEFTDARQTRLPGILLLKRFHNFSSCFRIALESCLHH